MGKKKIEGQPAPETATQDVGASAGDGAITDTTKEDAKGALKKKLDAAFSAHPGVDELLVCSDNSLWFVKFEKYAIKRQSSLGGGELRRVHRDNY
jgi:hypothetical protein